MSEAISLSFVTVAISPCDGEIVKWLMKVSMVTLFALCLASRSNSSVYAMALQNACKIFSLEIGALQQSLW